MGVSTDAREVGKTREDGLGWRVEARVCWRLGWVDVLYIVFLKKWQDSQCRWCSRIRERQLGWGLGEWDTLNEGGGSTYEVG